MRDPERWRKPSPEAVDRFHQALAGVEDLEVRKMFGMPAAFLAGNMAACLMSDTLVIRLDRDEREARLAAGWSTFEPMPGRVMREYVALPEDVTADVDAAREWIARAADYVRTLPPKEPKPRASRSKRQG